MRRLREETRSTDALHAEAGALVASERPITGDQVRRRRVLAAIESRGKRRAPVRWTALAATALVIALVGVAGAAIGRWMERRHPARPVVAPSAEVSPSTVVTPAPVTTAPPVPTPPAASAAPTVHPTSAAKHDEHRRAHPSHPTAAAPEVDPLGGSGSAPVEVPASAPAPATPPPTATRAPDEPTAEAVFAATRALRQDHKPRRAAKLLDAYMAKSPTGALAEEALALDIEAHLALGDTESVRLGRLYLDRFPAGRFRALAERAAHRER